MSVALTYPEDPEQAARVVFEVLYAPSESGPEMEGIR